MLGIFLAAIPISSQAATYRSGKWLVSGSFSYGVIEPEEVNAAALGGPGIPGLIGFHLQGERTLRAPDITQWVEVSYGLAVSSASASGAIFENTLSYLSVLPLGATYWFNRTAYIDFGVGLGLGLGLSPSFKTTRTAAGSTDTIEYSGGTGFLAEGRLTGRFWFSRFIALTVNGGLRIYTPTLQASGQSDVSASLVSLTGTFGATWALGGTSGLGRSFVEVLPPEQRRSKQPVPRAAPALPPNHSGSE